MYIISFFSKILDSRKQKKSRNSNSPKITSEPCLRPQMQVSVGTMTLSKLLYYLLFYFNHTFRSTLVVLFYHKKMVTPTKIHDKSQKMQRAQCLAMCFVHFGLQMKLCSANTRGRSCCLLIGRKLLCRLQCPHKVFLFRVFCKLKEVLDELQSRGSCAPVLELEFRNCF